MKNIITVDLSYGDSGKGTITDFLVNKYKSEWTVRFSGGGQAAHNVYVSDHHHTFSQFSSGSFNNFNKTYLSDDVIVNPFSMIAESEIGKKHNLVDLLDRVYVNNKAILTTPYHVIANRVYSERSGLKNTCGAGIWETIRIPFKLTPQDILDGKSLKILREIHNFYKDDMGDFVINSPSSINSHLEKWANMVNIIYSKQALNNLKNSKTPIVYENAQGVLLDDVHGLGDIKFRTPTKVTAINALKIIEDIPDSQIDVIGITRTYSTRHGDGPFKDELSPEESRPFIGDDNNSHFEWQGKLRAAPLDKTSLEYSKNIILEECADHDINYGLAVTHVDKLSLPTGPEVCSFPTDISNFLGIPLRIQSFGKDRKYKVFS